MLIARSRILILVAGAFLPLCAVAHPAFSQTYTVPYSSSMDISQTSAGTQFESSGSMGGLPSVTCGSGAAGVTFYFGDNWSIYRGGGSAYVQYQSDLMSSWYTLATLSEGESGGTWPPVYISTGGVDVSDLSTLQFRLYLVASTGNGGGYVIGGATVENINVTCW
jgi:hypothetical protein